MDTAYLQIIEAYKSGQLNFDQFSTQLKQYAHANFELKDKIFNALSDLKQTHASDFPLIQNLQNELRNYAPPGRHFDSSESSKTVIVDHTASADKPDETIVSETKANTETIIQSTQDHNETAIDNGLETYVGTPPKTPIKITDDSSDTVVAHKEPPQIPASNPEKLESGSVIKNRFILENILGEGGMGRVFKARDLRKEEAHDRNPYVAIKVLNESFKGHPQAFIALQREAKKAQTLAHPNIVNVYDFDRDGDTVFMTMEYLEGDSLDRILKLHYPHPFEKAKAFKIISGICQGLSYAHKRKIIHSDLKPGNVFVTDEGEVKVFDFGIARAIQTQDASGEKTLFDAGSLGGLTPAYASYEMIVGEQPDLRDDIYALGCIAYELLGGKHPFNKIPADKAKHEQAVPAKLENLSKQQNRALDGALSFERNARTESVEIFLHTLTVKSRLALKISIAAVIFIVIGSIVSYEPLSNYIIERKVNQFLTDIQSGDELKVRNSLKELSTVDPILRDKVLAASREDLITYYERKAFGEIDPAMNQYNFANALRYLNIATALYPDSAHISELKTKIQQQQIQQTQELTTRANVHIQQGNLLPLEDSDDLLDVLSALAKIDPNHAVLTDKRIPIAYSKQALKAASEWDFDKANQLIIVSLELFPNNSDLTTVQAHIKKSQQSYLQKQEEIVGKLDVKQLRSEINSLVSKPFTQTNWSFSLLSLVQQISKVLPADDNWLQKTKTRAAKLHLQQATSLRKKRNLSSAQNNVDLARKFDPSLGGIEQERQEIQLAKKEIAENQKLLDKSKHIAKLKQQLLQYSNNNDVKNANLAWEQLKALSAEDDTFVYQDAPEQIAQAYLRLGKSLLERGQNKAAAKLFRAGLEIQPKHVELSQLMEKHQTVSSDTGVCHAKLAGHGKRVSCFDDLGIGKGPALAVIPKSREINKAFAIGKYEISNGDWNLYCKDSKNCKSINKNIGLPVTNLSIQAVRLYLKWLSDRTGATYRLPNEREWTHSATATKQLTGKDFNCRIVVGGDVVKGTSLLSAKSGLKNSWGLANYVGNAQEWVIGPSNQLLAKGGSYQDPLTKCTISFSRPHNGDSDPITGFRVVREL